MAVDDTEYLLTFLGLLVVGIVISELTTRVRDQAEIARRRAEDNLALYSLSRDLAVAADLPTVLAAIEQNMLKTFHYDVSILLPGTAEPADTIPRTTPPTGAEDRPLRTTRGVVGTLRICPGSRHTSLSTEAARLLETFVNQAALAIERVQLGEQARQAQLLQATEKLQAALLNSISHDLRTPLVSITGVLSSLREDSARLPDEIRQELVDTAYGDAGRLNQLVANLLNMTRIEAGALQMNWEPCDVQDLVGSALQQLGGRLGDHRIQVNIPQDLPLVYMDFVLMVQVLVNLLENAVKYSPPDSTVDIHARLEAGELILQVLDRGQGIPAEALPHVFDKFYRVKSLNHVGGTGLGLAICKGFVDAHGGRLKAENRQGGGAALTIWLPAAGKIQDG
jgi:two-component system sensor histidine kinase KdpD